MEISDLKTFLAVADEGGFTAAARKLCCVQPNVTSRIKRLEEELGVQLFHRNSRHVEQTLYGREFYPHAEKIVRLSREAALSFQDESPRGPLSLGVTQTVASGYLPALLCSFQKMCPDVELTVQTMESRALPDALLNHSLDIAFAELPVTHSSIVTADFWTQNLVLASSKSYDRASEKGVTALAFSAACPYSDAMFAALKRHKIPVARQLNLYNTDTVLACIMGGIGMSVVPACMVQRPHIAPYVETLPVDEQDGLAHISMITHRDSIETAVVRTFKENASAVMPTLMNGQTENVEPTPV